MTPPTIAPTLSLELGLGALVGAGATGWVDDPFDAGDGAELGCDEREEPAVDEDEDGIGEDWKIFDVVDVEDGVDEDEDGIGEDWERIDVADVEDAVDETGTWVSVDAADDVIVGSANKTAVSADDAQAIYE